MPACSGAGGESHLRGESFLPGEIDVFSRIWQCNLLHDCVLLVMLKHSCSDFYYQILKDEIVCPDEGGVRAWSHSPTMHGHEGGTR